MPYENILNKSRLKDRSDTSVKSWTVASAFGGTRELKVTLVLSNGSTGNTFYEKHVLRHGEDPVEVFEVRNAEKTMKKGLDSGNADLVNKSIERMGTAQGWDIKSSGAPASTVIVLNKIDQKKMLYHLAKTLAEKRPKFSQMNKNYHVEIDFDSCKCVFDYDPHRKSSYYDSIVVGAQLQADDGAGRMTFDVNHCNSRFKDIEHTL
jgi:hypothetical protein